MAGAGTLISTATGQIGVKESPAGSNRVLYNDWYYGREVSGPAYPWCMTFVQWCAGQAGLSIFRTASCTALQRWAEGRGEWISGGYQPGDVVLFDFSGKRGKTEHVGIVESVKSGSLVTIEGNTGAGNDANGGEVQRRTRAIRLVTGAWRPHYDEEDEHMEMNNTPSKYAKECVEWAQKVGLMKGDTEGNLRLHEPVTREQEMVFLHRLYRLLEKQG